MNDLRRWMEALGLEPGATRQQLDEAYRDLVKVWHPDRFESDPALRLKAEAKLRDLNAAYEGLKRAGIPPPDAPPRVHTPPPPARDGFAAPATPPSREAEVRMFAGVLVATAVIVGALLFFGTRREAIAPAEIAVTPQAQPEPTPRRREPQVPAPPAPSPAKPTTGALAVISNPAGATIYMNDEPVGHTPLTLASIEPGAYRIRLELANYPAWSSSVRIEAGSAEKLIAFIEKAERP